MPLMSTLGAEGTRKTCLRIRRTRAIREIGLERRSGRSLAPGCPPASGLGMGGSAAAVVGAGGVDWDIAGADVGTALGPGTEDENGTAAGDAGAACDGGGADAAGDDGDTGPSEERCVSGPNPWPAA